MPSYYYDDKSGINRYVPDGWCGPGIPINPGLLGNSAF